MVGFWGEGYVQESSRECHDLVRETGRPLYVTNKGAAVAVVLSPEAFDALADQAELLEILAMVDKSQADLEAGPTSDAKRTLKNLADRHDLPRPGLDEA